eukprot:scaffold8849_cov101-Isochrysis_galbana.AAC.10
MRRLGRWHTWGTDEMGMSMKAASKKAGSGQTQARRIFSGKGGGGKKGCRSGVDGAGRAGTAAALATVRVQLGGCATLCTSPLMEHLEHRVEPLGVDRPARFGIANVGGLRNGRARDDLLAVIVKSQKVKPILDFVGDGKVHKLPRQRHRRDVGQRRRLQDLGARRDADLWFAPTELLVHLVDLCGDAVGAGFRRWAARTAAAVLAGAALR